MERKYLDENGLEKVAEYVNEKAQIFNGTENEFEALPAAEQKRYDYIANTESTTTGEVQTADVQCTIQGNIHFRKIGKIVQANYTALDNTQMTLPSGTWQSIATMPNWAKPANDIYLTDQGGGACIIIWLRTNGDIWAYHITGKTAAYELAFNETYIVD